MENMTKMNLILGILKNYESFRVMHGVRLDILKDGFTRLDDELVNTIEQMNKVKLIITGLGVDYKYHDLFKNVYDDVLYNIESSQYNIINIKKEIFDTLDFVYKQYLDLPEIDYPEFVKRFLRELMNGGDGRSLSDTPIWLKNLFKNYTFNVRKYKKIIDNLGLIDKNLNYLLEKLEDLDFHNQLDLVEEEAISLLLNESFSLEQNLKNSLTVNQYVEDLTYNIIKDIDLLKKTTELHEQLELS